MSNREPGMPQKVPWRALVDHGVVLNHDRSLLRTYRLRGPDLAAASEDTQGSIMWQLNNTFKRLGGAFALHDEAQRRRVTTYPEVAWPHPVPAFVDRVRRQAILESPTFETSYYLTLRWRMPSRLRGWFARWLLTNPPRAVSARGIPADVERFREQADHLAHLLRGVLAVCEPLTSQELLTYLHSTVSDRRHQIAVPRDRTRLNHDLCDAVLVGGWFPKLGDHHLRLCSVTNYPETSIAPALARMDHLPFEFRRVGRLIVWEKVVARGVFRRTQHAWLAQEKTPLQLALEQKGHVARVIDTHATNRAEDADAARQEVSGGYVGYGHYTCVAAVLDATPEGADDKIAAVRQIFEDEGFTVIIEKPHSRLAFHSAVAGNIADSVRRKPMSTLNVAHWSAGMKAAWPGQRWDEVLNAGPHYLAHTEGSTLFSVVNHVNRVGHKLVLGPTGAGKTTLLDFESLQWPRYWPCQVLRFAIGGGEEPITRSLDGAYYDLGTERVSHQPYRLIHQPEEFAFYYEWTLDRLVEAGIPLTDTTRSFTRKGLEHLTREPMAKRTVTQLVYLLTDVNRRVQEGAQNPSLPYASQLKAEAEHHRHIIRALRDLTGGRLDGDHDDLATGWYHTFEQETLLTLKRLAPGIMSHLFHQIERRLDGRPTLIEMDEATLPMVIPDYANELPAWAMTKRKQNVSLTISMPLVTLLDQEVLRPLLVQSCPTIIATPNPAAMGKDVFAVYEAMGFHDTMIQTIAVGRPGYEYIYKSPYGFRCFQLDLGGVLSAFCGSSNAPEDQRMIQAILQEPGHERFVVRWLRAKGYGAEADALAKDLEVWDRTHGGVLESSAV